MGKDNSSSRSWFAKLSPPVQAALISGCLTILGVVLNNLVTGYLAIRQYQIPIEATQTVEARLTAVALAARATATPLPTLTPVPAPTDTLAPTSTIMSPLPLTSTPTGTPTYIATSEAEILATSTPTQPPPIGPGPPDQGTAFTYELLSSLAAIGPVIRGGVWMGMIIFVGLLYMALVKKGEKRLLELGDKELPEKFGCFGILVAIIYSSIMVLVGKIWCWVRDITPCTLDPLKYVIYLLMAIISFAVLANFDKWWEIFVGHDEDEPMSGSVDDK
ncbi:MAG: hypothetical protein P8Z00_17075 [Anaerolineales bacterium]|jgi:hypothetical protein